MEPKDTAESELPTSTATSTPAAEHFTAVPPQAARKPIEHCIHGDSRVDDYGWLREKENPEVIRHLEAENAYTNTTLRPTEPFQEKLYQEMLSRIQQTDLTVPYKLRGFQYFTRTEEGKQYPIHFRRRDAENSSDELLLDLYALADGLSFLGIWSFDISDDNALLAYSTDNTGFRQYTLCVRDLRTGESLPDRKSVV